MEASIERIALLHPKLRNSALEAYQEAVRITPKGVHPVLTQTLRTFQESDKLYQQGRTTPGSIVTNSPGGSSLHNYGLAIDLVLVIDGKESWVVDDNWMKMIHCFTSRGWEWGGDWHSIKDYPHVQKTFGYTWQQLLKLKNEGKVDEAGYVII